VDDIESPSSVKPPSTSKTFVSSFTPASTNTSASNIPTVLEQPQTQSELPESPQLHWKSPLEVFQNQITSPRSTISSIGWGPDAPLRWFDLLAGDATANDQDFSVDLLSWRRTVGTPQARGQDPDSQTGGFHQRNLSFEESSAIRTLPPLTPSTSGLYPDEGADPWQVSIQLLDHEIPIFRRFVDRISLWMDLFDPMKHFSTFVPHLAIANEGLMKAILALASRHISIKPEKVHDQGAALDRTAAVQYYYETLHYLQGAMKYDSYTRSLELIATVLVVSMYEMIDGAGKGWERHLKGVFWIQRSRNIGAESLGLEGAGWWAWLRQDVWAAFRERRRVHSFHRPIKSYSEMDMYDLASKSVYLLAQAVNYSSEQDAKEGVNNLHARIDQARVLLEMLDEWQRNLTLHFGRLPLATSSDEIFQPIWINPSPLGNAIQMYHFARILLLVQQPAAGGFNEFLRREKQLSEAVDVICGIAMTIKDEPSSISSTQCLYAAGLYTHDKDPRKREAIVKLIDAHQMRTGWPVTSLTEELQAEWNVADSK
jgi:hypothetical protein